MKIARLGEPGLEIPVVIAAGTDGVERTHDARPVTTDIDGEFLSGGGIARLCKAVKRGELPLLEGAAALRVGSPVALPTT